MSDNNSDSNKIIGLKLTLSECSHGNMHVTKVDPIREDAVVYSAPDADNAIESSSVGWTRAYNANWEANFGDKPETEAN